jgi:hypothetical protein
MSSVPCKRLVCSGLRTLSCRDSTGRLGLPLYNVNRSQIEYTEMTGSDHSVIGSKMPPELSLRNVRISGKSVSFDWTDPDGDENHWKLELTTTDAGRLAIQEHAMILKATRNGVSERRIATVLEMDVGSIKEKRDLLNGICREVAEILKTTVYSFKDGHLSSITLAGRRSNDRSQRAMQSLTPQQFVQTSQRFEGEKSKVLSHYFALGSIATATERP